MSLCAWQVGFTRVTRLIHMRDTTHWQHVTRLIHMCDTIHWNLQIKIWVSMSRVTHMNESCHTCCRWVVSHIWMSRVTRDVNESCHTYEWVVSHVLSMSRVTHMNESCHTCCQWVVSRIWIKSEYEVKHNVSDFHPYTLESDSHMSAMCCGVLQCVAVCCRGLQCVAVCCSVLQHVAVWCRESLWYLLGCDSHMPAGCCRVLQCVAACCSVLHCGAWVLWIPLGLWFVSHAYQSGISTQMNETCQMCVKCVKNRLKICANSRSNAVCAVCCSILQRVAVCCSVLQCVVACCNVL